MFSQVQQALEHLSTALDSVEQAPTSELRRTLGLAKALRSRVELLETKAASLVARREQHGDGGAGLLSQHGGLSRSEAARNVRTDAELAEIPAVRSGVAEGEISLANAARLAHAARKTSPQAVQHDAEIVELAKSLPADEFAQEAQRWTVRHQRGEDLAAQHRRNRPNRNVRFWNGDDGSVQMRGSFDTEMGARIQSGLRHQAEQLRQADRRRARNNQRRNATDDANSTEVRTRDQRMADALDQAVTAAGTATAPEPASGPALQPVDSPVSQPVGVLASAGVGSPDRDSDTERAAAEPAPARTPHRAAAAQVIVRADLDTLLGRSGGIAEVAGAGPIPASTLQRILCNSDLSVVFFGDNFTPLYETTAARAPTAAQRRALIARDGSCIGCAAPPGECEAHHIIPWKRGGKTRVDNLVLVCWSCHDRIHDHNWQVAVRDGRYRIAPPDTAHRPPHTEHRTPNRPHPDTQTPTRRAASHSAHAPN